MKKLALSLILCLLYVVSIANDGVFFAAGNQLIPITETDIRVTTELLTVHTDGKHHDGTAYYEFFNPVGEKDLLVGFEAPAAYPPEERYLDAFPNQPHIRNFKVVVNDIPLSYEIAHVPGFLHNMDGTTHSQADYYQNGRFNSWTKQQCADSLAEFEYMSTRFYYVYHFNAHFKKGLNVVVHTYEYDLSYSVGEEFRFDYILSAANRWANNGIDDFTLNINLGDYESFAITPTFFQNSDEWAFDGKVRSNPMTVYGDTMLAFHVQSGGIRFHKANFHPNGELIVRKPNIMERLWGGYTRSGRLKSSVLVNALRWQQYKLEPVIVSKESDKPLKLSKTQRNILTNVPYAYRGYLFENKKIQQFFEATDWYIPNPAYKKDAQSLTDDERKWLQLWAK